MDMDSRPSVFRYFDYRIFMRDLQRFIKKGRPVFTLEHLGHKVGLKSKGHISLILKGDKNIPAAKISVFAQALELSSHEAEFFALLVQFNQAPTFRERKLFLDRMVALLRVTDRRLVPSQYALCEKWYHPAVHELLRTVNISDDWEKLASLLRPEISPEEAQASVAVLEQIGLVKKNARGFWKPTDVALTFGEGWKSVMVREFQRHTFDLAQSALDQIPVEERDISSLTLSLGEDSFREIRERIALFRKELLAVAKNEKSVDRVYQLSFSLFPLSRKS